MKIIIVIVSYENKLKTEIRYFDSFSNCKLKHFRLFEEIQKEVRNIFAEFKE